MRRLLVAGALAAAGGIALSLAGPDAAAAIPIPLPLGPLGGLPGPGDVITGGIGKAAAESFGAVIKTLFAWPAKMVNRGLLAWLVAVPDYAINPETAGAARGGSNLAQLGATTSAMAFAALGAVGTVSGIRYWAAGLTGSGGMDALVGLARTVGAALFIVQWPWLFRHSADLANQAGAALLGSGSVLDDTARLMAAAFAASIAYNILAILIAMGAAVLFLGLLLMKIVVSAATALVFVGMPLALMLWPIPELAWIARTAMRAFATVLAIPLAWAVSFATFAAVGVDALSLKGAGSALDALVMPLVALALLWITVVLPKMLARMAMAGALNGGGVGRTASYLVGRRADAALAQAVPAGLGGRRGGTSPEPSSSSPAHSGVRRAAVAAAGAAAGGPAGASAAGAAGGGGAGAGAAGAAGHGTGGPAAATTRGGSWKPPAGFPQSASGGGLRTPAWQEVKDHVRVELAAAEQRQGATGPTDVADAMEALRPEARKAVMDLMDSRGGEIRGRMAHHAARGDLSDSEREAFRTLAAATPAIRAQGIEAFLGGAPTDQPAGRDGGGGSSTAPGADAGPMESGAPAPPTPADRDRSSDRMSK
jgi:hypothetical protein